MNLITIKNSIDVATGAPNEFKVLPLGLVHSEKGDFLVDNESYTCIRNDFKERQLQIPVDYEHQTLLDVQAPAAGWIKEITLKTDGIYAVVDWTEKAVDYLKNREYKYCSPVIMARSSDRKAVKLHSVALTNKPAINAMTPIVNKDAPKPNITEDMPKDNNTPEVKVETGALAKLLLLPETATLAEIYQAVEALLNSHTVLKLKVGSAEFEAHKTKVDGIVAEALKSGYIAPYQRDWAFRNAMNDFEDFMLWLKTAPQVVPMGEIKFEPSTLKDGVSRSRAQELMGLSHEDVKTYGKVPGM